MRLFQQKQTQFVCIVIFALLVQSSKTDDVGTQKTYDVNATDPKAPQKTVKKELDKTVKPLPETTTEEVVIIGEKHSSNKNDVSSEQGQQVKVAAEQPQQAAPASHSQPKETEKTNSTSTNSQGTSTGNKTLIASPATSAPASPPAAASSSVYFHQDESIMQNNEEISDSLKTGFYFFVALSLSAVLFIVFKVYRLRLSRAERKYGVQGDRSTQELTPLPIAMEDGHSDDEDQTVFEVNRQNIRIL